MADSEQSTFRVDAASSLDSALDGHRIAVGETLSQMFVKDDFRQAAQQRIWRQQPTFALVLWRGAERFERYSLRNLQVADRDPTQRGQVRPAAERSANVLGESANVRSLAAGHAEATAIAGMLEQHQFADIHFTRLAFYLHALARQLVKRPPVTLERRIHRRYLSDAAAKRLQRGFEFRPVETRDAALQHLALGIASIRRHAEEDVSLVGFVGIEKVGGEFGGLAET